MECAMATVNFSVPEEVKAAFNATFANENKSAIITELMREAIARAERQRQHRDAIERILARQPSAPAFSEDEVRAARDDGRP
jgi:hypothetical protein